MLFANNIIPCEESKLSSLPSFLLRKSSVVEKDKFLR